ncbi:carboxypeptidase-like regulatory domain-containing protein, partial [Streptomyces sp. NPDC001635]
DPAMFSANTMLKDIEVRGSVTDTSGVGLPGVVVSVKGRNGYGVVTDVNGSYMIKVPEDAILVFSMVGFIRQEVAVGSREFYFTTRNR